MSEDLNSQMIEYIKDAHAMEASVSRLLDSMISATSDQEIRELLVQHKDETERHKQLLTERLRAHGVEPSTVKDVAAQAGAFVKGVADRARGDHPGKNARDAFTIEHLEIAAYELLERFAKRAGDEQTAHVARSNRKDEEAMAKKIDKNWDKFVELTIREEELVAS
jgi:ferritin-like metal-binding protein YciE